MNLEYPTVLIEYVLSGIVVASPFLTQLPDVHGTVGPSYWLELTAIAYALGIGANAAASWFFRQWVVPGVEQVALEKHKPLLRQYVPEIGNLLRLPTEVATRLAEDGELRTSVERHRFISRAVHYVEEVSEDSRSRLLYQNRLERMARSVLVGTILWVLLAVVWLIQGCAKMTSFPRSACALGLTTGQVLLILVGCGALTLALYCAAKDRMRYRCDFAIERLATVISEQLRLEHVFEDE